MQLWEQGKFHLDDPLAKYLPEYADMRVYAGKDAAGQPRYVPAERPIIVRDILRHTAGFVYGAGPTPAHDAYVAADPLALTIPPCGARSEEHTSELQSLMRISYAVFCLTKKNNTRPYSHLTREHT